MFAQCVWALDLLGYEGVPNEPCEAVKKMEVGNRSAVNREAFVKFVRKSASAKPAPCKLRPSGPRINNRLP